MKIQSSVNSHDQRSKLAGRLASHIVASLAVSLFGVAALPASAATLDRIKETGHIKLGYFVDAKPFSNRTDAGAEGYAVTLCQHIAERVKTQLSLPQLAVDWVPVTLDNDLSQVKQGNIDLLCAPVSQTLGKRQDVAFSIAVFPGGVRAVLRKDAAAALRNALAENPEQHPVWRGTPAAKLLDKKTFAVVKGTTSESWLSGKISSFKVDAKTEAVADYRTGLQQLLDSKVDVFFGDRALILGALDSSSRDKVVIFDRLLTQEPLAFALARGDDDFRLLVDRTLSESYTSEKFGELYAKWFGTFDDKTGAFFRWNTLSP